MYYPGWVARVNGKRVEIRRVDGALRGIPVSAGMNQVELEYAPLNFRVGAAISLFTLACLLGGWFCTWKRENARGGEMPEILHKPARLIREARE
jgi:uncharacterized membrane protein YfhO